MYAALINIPKEYYEAASKDGAGAINKMFFITIPQMKNIFILICINLTTGTLQLFDLPYMMTGGGPANQTLTPMLYLYNNYRDVDKGLGYTIAGALIIMVVISVINAVIFTIIKSEKSLEG
jgi:ABC-type sugar transport system permease subunit